MTFPVWSDPTAHHRIWLQVHEPDQFTAGGVSISGQVLGGGEYEYGFLVRPDDLPTLYAAFDVPADANPTALAAAMSARWAEVREAGVREWLDARGVPYEFWSRSEDW